MITKQEYMDLKQRRKEIGEDLKISKDHIKLLNKYLNTDRFNNQGLIRALSITIKESRIELKFLDLLLRETKQQLRERHE